MKTPHVLCQTSTGCFVQRIHHNNNQVVVNVTRNFTKARIYPSEAAASANLSNDMKHEGWVAKPKRFFIEI